MTLTLIVLSVLATLFLIHILFIHDWREEGRPYFFLVMLMVMCVGIGMELGLRDTKTYKKPLKPSKVQIECINGKCDTSYIYEFKD